MSEPLLEVSQLAVGFDTDEGPVHAVNDISFTLREGEALAIVGESGSGKSVTALSIMGLVPSPPGRVDAGSVRYKGRELLGASERDLRRIRGREIAMIYQDPMTSLNPALTVGRQITEIVRHHLGLDRRQAADRAAELLTLVGIPNAAGRLGEHPHQFSGGQRQRILIAMALSCDPAVLIADEPTTALDVTVQAQIIELVKDLRERLGMAIVWITHDLGVVAGLVDKVTVMYSGYAVEQAPLRELFAQPSHPYTVGLLRSLPTFGGDRRRLTPIPGSPPDQARRVESCPFAPRCDWVIDRCREEFPALAGVAPDHGVACHRRDEVRDTPPLAAAAP
ncbi:MAG: ABC transporter ATP-binding protein [Solirubrobacteraceae bacterium]